MHGAGGMVHTTDMLAMCQVVIFRRASVTHGRVLHHAPHCSWLHGHLGELCAPGRIYTV